VIRLSERVANRSRSAQHEAGRGLWRPPATNLVKGLLATALPLAALLYAPASIAATPADTAATHAQLQARYELDLAFVHDAPAAQASTDRLIGSIGRECRNVLAGAPAEALDSSEAPTPRASGERERSNRQQQVLYEELSRALGAGDAASSRGAIESYATATASLSWSDARIASLVHAEVAQLQESLTVSPPDVCTDMKAWAQSGYRLLSPASRTFRAAQAARAEPPEAAGSLSALLKPSEGAAELALLRRTSAVDKRLSSTTLRRLSAYVRLLRTLGSRAGITAPDRQAVLGRGRTRSGMTFTVRRMSRHESLDASCGHPVSVEVDQTSSHGNGIALSGSGVTVCLSGPRERRPATDSCSDGEASITTAVPGNVRTVRLLLSDGSSVSSAVVRIPRKDGGPAGVYVQAIRAERRRPVSLTELDRHDHVVQTVVLAVPACKREPRSAEPTLVNLVKGTVPGGQTYTIQAVIAKFGAHRDFSVTADVGGEGGGEEGPGEVAVGGSGAKKAFPWSRVKGCPPREFALLYGILQAPGDSVLARTPEGLVPLTKLALDAKLDARGPLVYGAFASLPSELIVRRSDGTTLYSESLVAKTKEDAEFCEGFAEG
jgi:hypothetical protein